MPVLLGTVFIFGPSEKPWTATIIAEALHYGRATAAMLPPFIIEELAKKPNAFEQFEKLKYVHYAGSALKEEIGNDLSKRVKLMSALGSTESGPWFAYDNTDDPSLWNYHQFCPSLGLEFEHRLDDMYEPVFYKKQELARWQPIFHTFPDLESYPTQDLMRQHPTKQDLWTFAGRIGDLVVLSTGLAIHTSKLENIIASHPYVCSAIIGGSGRDKPFLILELNPQTVESGEKGSVGIIWSTIVKANDQLSTTAVLSKELTLLANASNPFLRTDKGTVSKKDTIAKYQHEIDALYVSV